jgi:hypothetical protein
MPVRNFVHSAGGGLADDMDSVPLISGGEDSMAINIDGSSSSEDDGADYSSGGGDCGDGAASSLDSMSVTSANATGVVSSLARYNALLASQAKGVSPRLMAQPDPDSQRPAEVHPDSHPLTVKVKCKETLLEMHVTEDTTIGDFRQRVLERMGCADKAARLIHQGRLLSVDADTLVKSKVQHNHFVHCVVSEKRPEPAPGAEAAAGAAQAAPAAPAAPARGRPDLLSPIERAALRELQAGSRAGGGGGGREPRELRELPPELMFNRFHAAEARAANAQVGSGWPVARRTAITTEQP